LLSKQFRVSMSLQAGTTEEKSKWKNIVLTCLNIEE
jgi:hypothetical protein